MKTLYVKHRREWRSWLQKNSGTCNEVWLLCYKKDSGRPSIPYDDAVEEALCFGWIDSIVRKMDDSSYAQKYTPRKPQSRWSRSNIGRAERLIAEGKMTPAGLKVFSTDARRETAPLPVRLPENLEKQFKGRAGAWQNFNRFPPYYRQMTIGWVASAKKEETRLKRLKQLIEFSARNERIKFM